MPHLPRMGRWQRNVSSNLVPGIQVISHITHVKDWITRSTDKNRTHFLPFESTFLVKFCSEMQPFLVSGCHTCHAWDGDKVMYHLILCQAYKSSLPFYKCSRKRGCRKPLRIHSCNLNGRQYLPLGSYRQSSHHVKTKCYIYIYMYMYMYMYTTMCEHQFLLMTSLWHLQDELAPDRNLSKRLRPAMCIQGACSGRRCAQTGCIPEFLSEWFAAAEYE